MLNCIIGLIAVTSKTRCSSNGGISKGRKAANKRAKRSKVASLHVGAKATLEELMHEADLSNATNCKTGRAACTHRILCDTLVYSQICAFVMRHGAMLLNVGTT